MRNRWISLIFTAVAVLAFSPALIAQSTQQPRAKQVEPIRRTLDGKPDFSGTWKAGCGCGACGKCPNELGAFQTGIGAPRKNRKQKSLEQLPLTPFGKEQVERITSRDGEYSGESVNPGAPEGFHYSCGAPPGPGNWGVDLF